MKFILFLIVLVVLFLIFKRWLRRQLWAGYSYKKKEYVMTQAERDCFNALVKVANDKYWVFPQAHFSAFLDYHIIGQNWNGAFWHINGKSIDFLLCTKEQLSPVLAIELDDTSHEREDRQRRDIEEVRMFKTADMPLLRLQHRDTGDLEGLSSKVIDALNPPIIVAVPQQLTWYQNFFRFIIK